MAVSTDGAVYCWGKNTEGQLGLLGGGDMLEPTKLAILEGIFCKMVACGSNHSLILSTAGDVYSCGRDENGKLGHTLMMPGEKLTDLKCEFQPRRIAVHCFVIIDYRTSSLHCLRLRTLHGSSQAGQSDIE
jgi:alpha-tubulin suppressor-like RCC1 family protein